jgi:methionyl-tRNA synthetase
MTQGRPSTRYITTPIYYVNDRPHIGHAYTTIICDVWARFMRFAGHDVFFLTGTDEHGQKVEKSAAARGVSPQELADENAAEFRRVMGMFGTSNDDFIRTTEPRHERQVQEMVRRLKERGAIYLGEFEGWYDEGQEEYVTDTKAKEQEFKSAITGKALARMREQNYYFRLSAFQDRLEKLFADRPDFVRPEARRNEVLSRVREGLQDVPVSRTNFTWGVPMPEDPKHVIYVWIDALMNYITALGLMDEKSAAQRERAKYWPADFHVIGKEILWFHAVIWPAMLMALDLAVPKCVYAHSFWISEGQKMSKTLGNFIDLPAIQNYLDTYKLDAWRYYMATQGPLGAQDADFSASHFDEIYHAHLVNTVGNCASRVTAMVEKYFGGEIPHEHAGAVAAGVFDWPAFCAERVGAAFEAMEGLDLAGAIGAALEIVRQVDLYINETRPFKMTEESQRGEQGAILYRCAEAVRIASLLLWCAVPTAMEELWRALGQVIDPAEGTLAELARWGGLQPGTKVRKVALFPRIEKQAD